MWSKCNNNRTYHAKRTTRTSRRDSKHTLITITSVQQASPYTVCPAECQLAMLSITYPSAWETKTVQELSYSQAGLTALDSQ